jgi:stringent starvation protein B
MTGDLVPDVEPERSRMPPELVMKRAWPPVLVPKNCVLPPALVVMVAAPAVLVPENCATEKKLVVMVELAAVLVLENSVDPPELLVKVGVFEELLTIPVPLILKILLKEYAGAPALNLRVPTEAKFKNVMVVVFDAPNVAVLVGTVVTAAPVSTTVPATSPARMSGPLLSTQGMLR